MKQFERPSNEKGGSPQGEVHKIVNLKETECWVAQLSDEEIILIDALLSSLG